MRASDVRKSDAEHLARSGLTPDLCRLQANWLATHFPQLANDAANKSVIEAEDFSPVAAGGWWVSREDATAVEN